MQIEFYGANCVRVKTKSTSIVFDDNLEQLGAKPVTSNDDSLCNTNSDIVKASAKAARTFFMPGDYEVGDVMITGIAAQAHVDEKGTTKATIYRGITPEFKFVVVGHIAPELSEPQLEAIGVVDILFVPVGGNGYTLDAVAAAKIAKQVGAKLVVPTHFEDSSLKYEVPQSPRDEFVKILGLETKKVEGNVLKLKRSDIAEKAETVLFH